MTAPVPTRIGKYDVIGVIGRGGMGVVYQGKDPQLDRHVAIKMITGMFAENPDMLKRFFREAQSLGSLQHPNIVTVYDLGDYGGNPYLVMEYLEGEGLDAAMSRARPLSLLEKLSIIIQVCHGLAYAHRRGVIHRDIKPANIMLSKDGGVKIFDFGIAHAGDQHMTRTGQVMGTLRYMAPEQFSNKVVDSRTDIFSTGVVLYQLFTNHLPFEGENTASTMMKIVHEPPPPLGVFLAAYPAEAEQILVRALAKNPDDRYSSADELALDLTQLQSQIKEELIGREMQEVELFLDRGEVYKAQSSLIRVLKIDQQHTGANRLLREVQQRIKRDEISKQVRELRERAEDAMAGEQFDKAQEYVDRALALDRNNGELQQLRETIHAAVVRAEKLHNALKMAESAHEEGKLDAAREAVEAALAVAPDDTAARTLHRLISREIEDRNRQQQMEAWLAEARQQISSRKFTAALEILKRAEELDPGAPEVQSLMESAAAGQEQERRRRELEALIHEVDAALNSDDYRTALQKADEGLARFPEDRNLLRLKAMADRQRQAEERRKFVDEQLAAARSLLQAGRNQELKEKLEQAIAQIGAESRLQSLLAVVSENLRREWLERLKSEGLPRARQFLDDQAFDDAVQTLEQLTKEIADDPEIQNLLDRARSERTHVVQDALRRAEHEPVLDLRVNILEEALRKSPQDGRLKEQLHNVRNLIDVVSRIGAEAQTMEAEHDYDRALAKWETIGTFYPQYPDLKNILKHVRGLRDRAHAEARQNWVNRIASALNACDYTQASAMLGQATQEFPVDSDLMDLKERTEAALRQRAKAQKMLAEGRGLFDNQQWEPGAQIMMRAYQLASQDLRIRDQAVSELALASRETIEKNWRASEFILRCLEEIQPGAAGSAELQATIQKRRREEAINGAVEAARRKLASGDLQGSLKELEQPLGWYPDDRRLLELKTVLDARIQQAREAARLEEERRQKEAFVLDALNRARQTADLDKRVEILEESLRTAPQEPRLQQQFNAARELRSKVASLVSDARGFEQARQYDQALVRWESVAAVYRDYPDLARILDQARQRQQQARIEARANCVRMLQLALSSAEYKRAEDLLAQAKRDFPGDRELAEIEKKVREGIASRAEAEKCLAGAAKAVEKAKWKKALECYQEACAAARSDPVIRGLVVSGLLAAAGAALQSDGESAEVLMAEAARVEPGSTLLGPVRAKIAEWKRVKFTEQCLGVVQRSLSAGDREAARRTVGRGLEAYPDEPRLLEARERIESEFHRHEEDLRAREQREREAREKELRDKAQREEEKRLLREQELRQREASEREARDKQQREKEQREQQQRERERLEAQRHAQARELEQSRRQPTPPVSASPADVSATGIFRQAVQAQAPAAADLATRVDLPVQPPPIPPGPKLDQSPAAPASPVQPPQTRKPAEVPGTKSGQTVRAATIFTNPDRRTTSLDGDLTHITPGIGSDEVNEASLHIIERQLAAFIGPLAKVLVKRAAGKTTSVLELYTILAPSLERDEDRQAFLARRAELAKGKTSSSGLTSAVPSLLTTPLDISPSSEITPAVIEQAARRLAAHLGAIAPILAKKEAKRAATVRNFYELLAERVVDPAERARFMKESGF